MQAYAVGHTLVVGFVVALFHIHPISHMHAHASIITGIWIRWTVPWLLLASQSCAGPRSRQHLHRSPQPRPGTQVLIISRELLIACIPMVRVMRAMWGGTTLKVTCDWAGRQASYHDMCDITHGWSQVVHKPSSRSIPWYAFQLIHAWGLNSSQIQEQSCRPCAEGVSIVAITSGIQQPAAIFVGRMM